MHPKQARYQAAPRPDQLVIPEPADIFKTRQGIAGNHSRVLSDYAFPFFSRKNEKKREKLRLPPALSLAPWRVLKISALQMRFVQTGSSSEAISSKSLITWRIVSCDAD